MATKEPEQARFKVNMDGEWDLDDLRTLTTSIRLAYAYFYWALQEPLYVDQTVRGGLSRYFWTGEYVGDRFAQTLYDHIPEKKRLKLVSIHYASPGWMELAGFVPVIMGLGWVTRIWIKNFDQAFDLFKKVDNYFSERKLRDLRKTGSIKDIDGDFIDEARTLCFEYGRYLGLKDKEIENVITLVGNPIAALRLLVAMSSEARRLHELEAHGKISLPAANDDKLLDDKGDGRGP
jgi:hypothetical protein